MFYKRVLDLGCGHADISGVLHRLGADITAVDARPEHLKTALKKYPGIKTVKADLDRAWPFPGQSFDMILDLDLICHLKDYEVHLRDVCKHTNHLVLETAVCDSEDAWKSISSSENKSVYDQSINGVGNFPTTAAIERILSDCGMDFRRQDNSRYNSNSYCYDWQPSNNEKCNINNRRLWYALKKTSPIQFAKIKTAPISGPPETKPTLVVTGRSPHTMPAHMKEQRISNNPPVPTFNYSTTKNLNKKNTRFVIVIPSYKNTKWCERNIQSAIDQDYDNYRVIFVDDNSPDDTFEKVSNVVKQSNKSDKITLIKNTTRVGALENLYNMIYSCDDEEVILTLDGDDWLSNRNVLNILNKYYSDENVWMTYGQYQNFPTNEIGISKQIPQNVIDGNSFRQYTWCSSHLRTFYTWLFKQIKKEDLMYEGRFMSMTWDGAIQYPQLEMAGNHSKFISDILYIYNLDNPLNDHKVDVGLQQKLDHIVRTSPKYNRLSIKPNLNKKSVGLFLIATNKYDRFLQGIISSADNFFLKDACNVTYYVFTDSKLPIKSTRHVVYIPIEHKSFPYASMDRFKHFTNNANLFNKEDYLFYVDVDCLFVDHVGTEILSDLVGVQHCGFVNQQGTYEDNPNSVFYTDVNRYKSYKGGGFSGGKRENYLELSRWCSENIEKDLANGHMPKFHDETAINRYFLDHEPTKLLTPSYHYPQGDIERYKRMWQPNVWKPKILLLDKNHNEIRN